MSKKFTNDQNQRNKQNSNQPSGLLYALGGLVLGGLGALFIKDQLDENNKKKKDQQESRITSPNQSQQIQQQQQQQQQPQQQTNQSDISELLICPITNEFIRDAAQLNTCGHTFERQPLEQWLDKNHSCPQCRVQANRENVIKNYSLQQILDQYSQQTTKQ